VAIDFLVAALAAWASLKHGEAHGTHHLWATWCGSCVDEFSDFQDTYKMDKNRDLELVTVSANMPDEKAGVLKILVKKHATSRNLLFGSNNTAELQTAFDPTCESAVPYTTPLDADRKVLYKSLGTVDILELLRTILANLQSDYTGFNQYWQSTSTQSDR